MCVRVCVCVCAQVARGASLALGLERRLDGGGLMLVARRRRFGTGCAPLPPLWC